MGNHGWSVDKVKIGIFFLGMIHICVPPFLSVLAGEKMRPGETANPPWKPGAAAKERYRNASTSASFVWLFLVDQVSGAKMEVVTENAEAIFLIGRDAGLGGAGESDGSSIHRWAEFMEGHEGKDVRVSSAVHQKFLPWNITGTKIPPDLIGSQGLAREEFIGRYFEKAPWGDTIPKKHLVQGREALVFIKFCILQDLDVRRGCETGRLFLHL